MLNRFLWAPLSWTIFVTTSCLVSPEELGKINDIHITNNDDKYLHSFFYFIFTLLWYFYIKFTAGCEPLKARLIVFLTAVGYGITIELCQLFFTAERTGDVRDALANSCGSAIAIFVLWLYSRWHKTHS